MGTRQAQMNLFEVFRHKKLTKEGWKAKTDQRLIYCTESKMKEFQKNFGESLLEGVKAVYLKRCLFFI
jgi:hypothetical protein